jgi:hypothetical protein
MLKRAEDTLRFGKVSFIYCEIGFQKSNSGNTYFLEYTEYLAQRDYLFFDYYQIDYHV